MLAKHIELPLQHLISRITQRQVLHIGMEARVFLIVDDLLLELDDIWLDDELGLNRIAGHYLGQRLVPDEVLKENRQDELIVAC